MQFKLSCFAAKEFRSTHLLRKFCLLTFLFYAAALFLIDRGMPQLLRRALCVIGRQNSINVSADERDERMHEAFARNSEFITSLMQLFCSVDRYASVLNAEKDYIDIVRLLFPSAYVSKGRDKGTKVLADRRIKHKIKQKLTRLLKQCALLPLCYVIFLGGCFSNLGRKEQQNKVSFFSYLY